MSKGQVYRKTRSHRQALENILVENARDHLTSVRKSLGLNFSDLASILGVRRSSIYAWLDGDEPTTEEFSQIVKLKTIAEQVDRLSIPRFEKLVKRPIFDGISFFDKLKLSNVPLEHLETLKRLGEEEHAVRKRSKGMGRTVTDDGFLEYTTPLYHSDS